MKPGTNRLLIVCIIVLAVALILNAILTWGICFEHSGGFQWSGCYIFEDIFTDKQRGMVTLRDDYTEFPICIPGVFYIYRVDPPPYDIRINVDDETESFEKIFMELISIEYTDGREIHHNVNWEGKFRSGSILYSMDSKNVEIPAMRFHGKLPVTVDRRKSCKIKFVGYFLNKEGDKILFDTEEYFQYETPEWRIYPLLGSF